MRKNSFLLPLLLVFSATAFAVDQSHIISAGAGFPNLPRFFFNYLQSEKGFSSSGTGPFHLKYEHRMNRYLGLGLSINHMSYTVDYQKDFLDTVNGRLLANDIRIRSVNTAFNLRANLHFLDPDRFEKIDPYLGIGIGYRAGELNITAEYAEDTPKLDLPTLSKLGLELTFGIRWHFSERIGMYAELGPAKSIIQAGICVGF